MKLPDVSPERLARIRRSTGGANTPITVAKMGMLVDDYWTWVRKAPAEGRKVAWSVAAPGGAILTNAAGMSTVLHAAYAPYCTARRQEVPILEASHDYGFLPDTCSYVRIHTGLLRLWETGQIERIPESHRIPKPDLVIGSRTCAEHATLAELVGRYANCPYAFIDIDSYDCQLEPDQKKREEMLKSRVVYVDRQLREDIIPLIERVNGRPYDYVTLSEMLANIKKVAKMRDEVLQLMRNKPAPATMFDLGISIGNLIFQAGRPETVAYYSEFLSEVKERAAKGIGVVSPENYRLYWDGYSTWALLGTMMRILVPRGGIPILGRYILGFWPHPDEIDPERPVWTLANHLVRYWGISVRPHPARELIMDIIPGWSCDGMILLNFVTCRMWNVGQEEFAEEAERRFGIPSLVFTCDMIDRAHINEAQLKTRVEAFLEMIDARRSRWV